MNRLVLASVTLAALAGASVLGWIEVRQARDFRRLLAVGDAALARNESSAAIEAFSGAIALRRDSMLGWLKRGDTYRRRGDFPSAVRDLEEAARLDPTALRPIELLGDVKDAVGDHARAAALYSRIVALDDRAPRVLYKLGLAQFRAGRAAAAIEPVKRAIALDPDFTEAHYLLGLCERSEQRAEAAAAAFTRALAVNPGFIPARDELAALDAGRGRRRDSIEQLEAIAALEPGRPERWLEVARMYANGGRTEAAVLTLSRAADRYPADARIHVALAGIWLDLAEQGEDEDAPAKAAEAIRAAAARDDQAPGLALLRGRAQLLAGNARAAERSLQAATTTLPVNPAAFRYLADAAQRVGHADVSRLARARFDALAR